MRNYGQSGRRVISGSISNQINGESSTEITTDIGSASTSLTSRPNVKPVDTDVDVEGYSGPSITIDKNSATRDLADVANGSTVGIERVPNENSSQYHGQTQTGISVKKPTDNIYY